MYFFHENVTFILLEKKNGIEYILRSIKKSENPKNLVFTAK